MVININSDVYFENGSTPKIKTTKLNMLTLKFKKFQS